MKSNSHLLNRAASVLAVQECAGDINAASRLISKNTNYVRRWWTRYQNTGSVNDAYRGGRPSVFTASKREKACELLVKHQSVPHVTGLMVQSGDLKPSVHRSTLLRHVKKAENGMRCRPDRIIPFISANAKAARVRFAKAMQEGETEWSKVMAIDSCMFRLVRIGGRRRVWMRKDTKTQTATPLHPDQLHVYGGICSHGHTELVECTGTTGMKSMYMTKGKKASGVGAEEFQDIMGGGLIPDAADIFEQVGVEDWQLLQDNARPHTAKSTQAYLAQEGVTVLPGWPACSPDLNPIENVWGWMKSKVYRAAPKNMSELRKVVQEAWASIPPSMTHNLMASMPARLAKVIEGGGEYIKK